MKKSSVVFKSILSVIFNLICFWILFAFSLPIWYCLLFVLVMCITEAYIIFGKEI